ncbi:MAG: hypothetical protein QOD99_2535 [Chthoniobacter sp.]|jgi:sugar phosphate isomerase/epimerase|nr:hypothetical protein [Chthoniobacter sp.]
MLISAAPETHLTYCLNVHHGESWGENFAAIQTHALEVRDRVAPGKRFGLGLRLSELAARELASTKVRGEFKGFLESENLYVFTINGFPFGRFHGGRVKEQVYAPDWRSGERRNYTNLLADILADLLPPGIEGSISTVPGSFKPWIATDDDVRAMVRNLAQCAGHLAELEKKTGKTIHLGLEPEPSCFLETTDETVEFFGGPLRKLGAPFAGVEILNRHLGVCFDTCHVAMQFEDPVESLRRFEAAQIRISKVQLSAALRAPGVAASWAALEPFCEPVYLHQTKARSRSAATLHSWVDLPEALQELPRLEVEEARVHFHVPLFCKEFGALHSTAPLLSPEFFRLIADGRGPHWEIETYTFDVLPPELRSGGVEQSIAREFDWVQARAGVNRPAPAA